MDARSNFDANLTNIAGTIFIVNSCISFTIFPLMIYMIITQSKKMKIYKYYLLNSVICCQVFELHLPITNSIFLVNVNNVLFD
jgi:hypothetical protein